MSKRRKKPERRPKKGRARKSTTPRIAIRRVSDAELRHKRVLRAAGLAAMTLLVAIGALVYPWVARGRGWLAVGWEFGWVLVALAVVPAVWWWGTFGQDRRRPRLRLGWTAPLRDAPRGWRVRVRDLPGVLRAVAVALFIGALAGPVVASSDDTAKETGIEIQLVIDLSNSMEEPIEANLRSLPQGLSMPKKGILTRLETAKLVVQDFIRRRRTDRIGAVVFAEHPFILSPPTLDYQLLSKLVARLDTNTISGNGTAIGDAVGTAVARMQNTEAKSKVVILLTDGANTAGKRTPEYAIELANAVGCKLYTILIGEPDAGAKQKGRLIRRSVSPTDPELLQKMADQTGGRAFVATDAQGLRDSMHAILDQLDKTQFEANVSHKEDLFPLLLLPGVVLLGVEALLRSLLLRRFP